MRPRSIFMVLCFFTASLASAASVKQAHPPPTALKEVTPYEFLDAVVDSLVRSHVAITAVNEKANDPSLVERMTANQNANIELDLASRNIQRFISVKDETMRDSASASVHAYGLMRKSLAIQLAVYGKMGAAKTLDDVAGLRRQTSDAKVSYEQASRMLVDAATLAFMSTVVADPKDPANHVALNITSAQTAELVKTLESRFGPALRKKTDDETGPMRAAKVLLANLEKTWRHAK